MLHAYARFDDPEPGDDSAEPGTESGRSCCSWRRALAVVGLALLLLIGLAYGTALSTMDLETGPVSRLKWSIPAVGWSWSLMLLMGSETRWDRVSTATLLTLLLGSLQCLWIDGF